MNPPLPWLESTILLFTLGAIAAGLTRSAGAALRAAAVASAAAFGCACAAGVTHGDPPNGVMMDDRPLFDVDELAAPLVPLVAAVVGLVAVGAPRSEATPGAVAAHLFSGAMAVAVLGLSDPGSAPGEVGAADLVHLPLLLGLVAATRFGPAGQSPRLFAGVSLVAFAMLAVAAAPAFRSPPAAGAAVLLAALVLCGAPPFHLGLTDLFAHKSLGTAVLFAGPLTGLTVAARLAVPTAPAWALDAAAGLTVVAAVLAAGLAVVARDPRRMFAFLTVGVANSALAGVLLADPAAVAGGLTTWAAGAVSLAGLAVVLRAVEARSGRLALDRHHGLYDRSPALAVAFLVFGLSVAGFPGLAGFVAAEVLVGGALHASPAAGVGLAVAAALAGVAVVRAYLLVFTGARHESQLPLGITPRERVAVLGLALLVVAGGLWPQPLVASRFRAAEALRGMTSAPPVTKED